MIIYSYKPSTGEYISTGEAKESPREPGVFLIPANAVTAAPPIVGVDEVAVWNGEEWEVKPDFRGRVYYDKTTKEKHEITEIGISPDVNWTDVEPIDSEAEWNEDSWKVLFAIFVKRKKAEIAQARYNAEIAGVTINGVSIKTDRESQGLITGAALKATQDSTYTCKWKGVDGFVELTAPQIIAVADAVRQHVQSCFDHEAELLPLIESAETEAELEAISW